MDKKDEFFKLFLKNNKKLYGLIVSFVPNISDADDVLQETAAVLWTKFGDFEMGTNFYAWAKQIALYKIKNYYRQKKLLLRFDQSVLDNILEANESINDNIDKRMTALKGCLGKLKPHDINLIQARYQKSIPVRQISEKTQVSVSLLYKDLARIHALLKDCISRTLAAWEAGR